ncbi:hypothetical protein M409DRAFT_61421 [Zasmidium cellare ATCC 36951]|uniref:Uncharacterized protein n=1 Tax=Zasmidium cellare ATCC 36951 TaxID=1080233 RepID=A0A6A6BVB4_ZASCE|nr:uncharacterized protein M409DRAFT_61421 [Zasmidium cellare ATCC 36951]KAF2158701.1 hypothetical protein M409DRAFT_61421 [Zasmidium cellare ATCC 36951]
MSTVPVTVHLPAGLVDSIRRQASRKSISTDDMIALSENVCKGSKAIIDAVKEDRVLPGVQHTGMSTHSGKQRSYWDSQFLITIHDPKRKKAFPVKVRATTDFSTVAEIVAMHEGIPVGKVLLRDQHHKAVYRRDGCVQGTPVKWKQLDPAGVKPGDILTLHLNEDLQ